MAPDPPTRNSPLSHTSSSSWTEAIEDLYGPIIYFRIFSRQFVVLNTLKSTLDLLENRSAVYATKPVLWLIFLRGFLEPISNDGRRKLSVLICTQEPFAAAVTKLRAGTAGESWVANAMLDESGHINIVISSGSLCVAGVDTTVSAIYTFILMMSLHPEIKRKA
ncbi:hypothetical protein K438DRAFT_1983844 [Mycena galopus ATCC 62051]|nr:hypothetical protein K438DRAFT_1983844 [Mycena galopus ATCC 62051]